MCHDFTDTYNPHIAIERDLNSYHILGNFDFEDVLLHQVLVRSTKFWVVKFSRL